jgi:hypothetical protein
MQKRNVIAHATAIGLLIAASLGIFQAVGAASNPAIASSSKFSGPVQPASSWFARGSRSVGASVFTSIATPLPGAGLVIQSVTYASEGGAGVLELYSDSQTDPAGHCEDSDTLAGGYDYAAVSAGATIVKNFLPGIVIPAGDELCAATTATIVFSMTGYNIPGTAVAHPTVRGAAPKLK